MTSNAQKLSDALKEVGFTQVVSYTADSDPNQGGILWQNTEGDYVFQCGFIDPEITPDGQISALFWQEAPGTLESQIADLMRRASAD